MTSNEPTDENGAPIISGLAGKLMTLMRRLEHLERQLDAPVAEEDDLARARKAAGRRRYIKAERDALVAAIRALNYHRAHLDGLDEPVALLRQIVDHGTDPTTIRRARSVLADYGA